MEVLEDELEETRVNYAACWIPWKAQVLIIGGNDGENELFSKSAWFDPESEEF